MHPVIEVLLTCDLCGLKDVVVYVPERTEAQDVKQWMDTVCLPYVCDGHRFNSPTCQPKTLTNIKIPLSTKGVGFLPTGNETPYDGPL